MAQFNYIFIVSDAKDIWIVTFWYAGQGMKCFLSGWFPCLNVNGWCNTWPLVCFCFKCCWCIVCCLDKLTTMIAVLQKGNTFPLIFIICFRSGSPLIESHSLLKCSHYFSEVPVLTLIQAVCASPPQKCGSLSLYI